MELVVNSGFSEMSQSEMELVDGGFLGTVLFTIGAVKVTVGMCMAAGAAVGLVAGGAVILKN